MLKYNLQQPNLTTKGNCQRNQQDNIMLIFFDEKSNSFDKNNLINFSNGQKSEYVQCFMPTMEYISNDCKCPNPKCGAINKFKYHSFYQRYISFTTKSNIITTTVMVTRVYCSSCGTTHALLPSFIVPYVIMSKDSILEIVSSAKESSVLKIANKLNTTIQLIYTYIALLCSFFPNIHSLNNKHLFIGNLTKEYYLRYCIRICNCNLCSQYITFFQKPFLMQKYRNKPTGPPFIGMPAGIPRNSSVAFQLSLL